MFDLLIKNGSIIDGSGADAFHSDIGINDGKITAIGNLSSEAIKTLDATGLCVTPGFLDIHRHADVNIFSPSFGEAELRQGLTCIVNGNCGLSAVPCDNKYRQEILNFLQPVIGITPAECKFSTFVEYMNTVDKVSLPLNIGMLVGNGTVRASVKGYNPTAMTNIEIEKAKTLLREALNAGALGISMGLVYAPENCYTFEELTQILTVAEEYSVPLVTHIRGEGDLFHKSLEEVIAIAKKVNAPLHISHLKCIGKRNWGHGVTDALKILHNARNNGMKIDYDIYPYTAGSTQLLQILPPEFLDGGTSEIVQRLLDPKWRKKLAEILPYPQLNFENLVSSIGWENIRCTSMKCSENQQYLGKSIAEIAIIRKQDLCECVCDLLASENGNIAMVDFITCEEDITKILLDPYTNIISDSVYPSGGVPHPRLYGTFPRVLQKYVREEKILTLENAIYKMTSLPAKVYQLNKGLLKVGKDADITIFSAEKVGTDADYNSPYQFGKGFNYVIVNGQIALENDKITGIHAGTLLRNIK